MKWGKVIAGTAAAAAAGVAAATAWFFNYTDVRPKVQTYPDESDHPVRGPFRIESAKEIAWAETLPQSYKTITTFDGLRLIATLIPAEQPSKKTVICIHGFHANHYREYATFIRFYRDLGYNVLLPDNRAHGESEGKYIGYGWLDRLDLLQWIQVALKEYGTDSQIVLQGVSMGAATVLMASGEKLPEQVKAIVADCPYTSLKEELRACIKARKVPVHPLLETGSVMNKLVAGYSYEEASALEQVKKSVTPTIFFTGDADDFVPTEMTHELYEACAAKDKEIWVVAGAGHAEAHVVGKEAYEEKVKAFLEKHVK